MLNTTIIICLFFVIRINAGVSPFSQLSNFPTFPTSIIKLSQIPTSTFNITKELDKISKDCLTNAEHHELTGNKFRGLWARYFDYDIIEKSVYIIGNSEIRKALGFGPPGPWNNEKFSSREQLNAAKTLEEYFTMQTVSEVSYDARISKITEQDFATAIRYLDKRVPEIRLVYQKKVEEFMKDQKQINRKMVDDLTDYIYEIYKKLMTAVETMRHNSRCWWEERRDLVTSNGFFSSLFGK